jgi:hypothetical protein
LRMSRVFLYHDINYSVVLLFKDSIAAPLHSIDAALNATLRSLNFAGLMRGQNEPSARREESASRPTFDTPALLVSSTQHKSGAGRNRRATQDGASIVSRPRGNRFTVHRSQLTAHRSEFRVWGLGFGAQYPVSCIPSSVVVFVLDFPNFELQTHERFGSLDFRTSNDS